MSITTKNGYDLWELISALQKDIRRGNEKQAVFWALELESINPTTLWNRLMLIASEDIGPANSQMSVLIDVLHRQYQNLSKSGEEGLFLIHAVLALSRSKKTREVGELFVMTYPKVELGKEFGEGLPPIPDYAIDMHTPKGREKGKGLEYFYSEGTKINPDAGSKYREEALKFERTELAKAYWSRLGTRSQVTF